ncbi:MAG TPA: DUF222 domain-containing protein [Rugosimonospora sp.]|nr:DUF222 domain-containing protein [Rugosimonospora sp.]
MCTSGAGGLVDRLRTDFAELVALDPTALSDVELLDMVAAVAPVVCQARAAQTGLIGVAHRRGAVALDGSVSTVAWLRNRLHLGDAPTQVRVATALEGLPHLAEAYRRGDISYAHAALVTEVARDIAPEVLAAGADKLLAEQAATLPPGAARRAAIRVRDHFDPEAAERRTARLYRERWLSVAETFGGAVSIQGVLDPDGGRLLQATLAALTPPANADDSRSPGARRADALVQACRQAADAAPTAGGEKPHVSVIVDWPTLRDQVTAGPHAGAVLDNGVPVNPSTARRLACDATLIPALLGAAGEPLDIGRASRVVPSALRRALVLRDGGCRFPPCDRCPEWTDAHHLIHWAAGGPTCLDNLVLLCRAHHTAVHEGGWSIRLDPVTNVVTARHRTGRQHASLPRGFPAAA